MKRLAASLCLFFCVQSLSAYKVYYAEQWYDLYHQHYIQYPDDAIENIYYLEQALKADFANPLNAKARIENEIEWEKYRYLFSMQVNLKLIEQHLLLAVKYDKFKAYFYNYPWKQANLDSLEKAEGVYKLALLYWDEVKSLAEKAYAMKPHLSSIQQWEDQCYRVVTGDLDYDTIIQSYLSRLEKVRSDFLAMNSSTY